MSSYDEMFLETARQLKEAAHMGRSFESAQVKIIGLDDIRRAVGEDWPIAGSRIRSNSMHFLQGCLGEDDLVIPAGDGFLVIYAQSGGRDFEAQTAALQDSLNAFYLGEEATKSLRAEVKYARVDSRGLVHKIGKIDGASPVRAPDAQRHEFSFVPVWNVKQEALTACWVAPIYRTEGVRCYGYDASWAETRVNSGDDYLSFDLSILGRAVQEAERALASGRRSLMCFSVHSTTLQRRDRRQAFLESLYTTPETLRPYLIGRIAEIEPGTPITTMSEWVHQLRPVSKRVTIHLHESDRALTGLDSTGAFSVSFTLSARQHEAAGRESYERHIARWSAALRSQKVHFRLDNVLDGSLIALAVAGNVDFLTSQRFWPIVSAPKGVSLFSTTQLREALANAA